ncbi:hypothetical protein C0J52_01846, partial [Blattella germanica]
MNPPTNKSILKWYNDFVEKGCICNQRKGHSVSVEVVNRVRETFLRSPKKSTRRASRLRFRPYKLQLVQKLQPQDKVTRSEFC